MGHGRSHQPLEGCAQHAVIGHGAQPPGGYPQAQGAHHLHDGAEMQGEHPCPVLFRFIGQHGGQVGNQAEQAGRPQPEGSAVSDGFLVGLPQLQDAGSRRQEDGQGRPVGNPCEFQWRDAIHATFTITERRGRGNAKSGTGFRLANSPSPGILACG